MSDKSRDPKALVEDLLASFQGGTVEQTKLTVETNGKSTTLRNTLAIEMDSPQDAAAVFSVLVSVMMSALASGSSGYARAVREQLFDQVASELTEKDSAIEARHIDLARKLLAEPLKQLIKRDDDLPYAEVKLPFQVRAAVVNLISYGLAMYRLGKKGEPIQFTTGLQHALLKVLNNIVKDAGVAPNEGTLTATFLEVIQAHTKEAQEAFDAHERTAERDQQPGVPEDGS